MDPALEAANEINARWAACLDGQKIENADCPSNEEVAEIIRKHLITESKK